jgi:hypothetical protein
MGKKLAAILVATMLALLAVGPVFAVVIDQPDSMAIISARGFTDLAETGDVAMVFHWDIPYYGDNGTYPIIPASASIVFQLYAADGVTLLNTAAPYVYAPFLTNGYRQGVSVFYFTAADAITPGGAFQIRIQQSVTYYATPTSTTYTMTAGDWANDTQADMKAYVLALCDSLLLEYPTVTLASATDIGKVLGTYGDAYFTGAIPGVRMMCPALFYVQDYVPAEMAISPAYDSTLQDSYSIRMQGSEIKRGADRLGTHFGLTGYFILGSVFLVASIACAVLTMRRGWGLEPGGVAASIICIYGAWMMGNAVFTILMIMTLIGAMAIMFTFVGRRA